MKKILLTVSAVLLGVSCFSLVPIQSFADCDGECEIPRGPGGSAYVFIPLPGYSAPSAGMTDSGVMKKGRVIGNNEFGFGTNEADQEMDLDETIIDPTTLPVE